MVLSLLLPLLLLAALSCLLLLSTRSYRTDRVELLPFPLFNRFRPIRYSLWVRLHSVWSRLLELEHRLGFFYTSQFQQFLLLSTLLYSLLLLTLFLLPWIGLLLSFPLYKLPLITKWGYLSSFPYENWIGFLKHCFSADPSFSVVEQIKLKRTPPIFRYTATHLRVGLLLPLAELLSLLLLTALPLQLYTLFKLSSYSASVAWNRRLWSSRFGGVRLLLTANRLCRKTNGVLLPLFLLHLLLHLLLLNCW